MDNFQNSNLENQNEASGQVDYLRADPGNDSKAVPTSTKTQFLRRKWFRNLLFFLLSIGIAIPGFVLSAYWYLVHLAEQGVSGTEYFILPFLPLLAIMPILLPLGAVSALLLVPGARRKGVKVFLIILGVVLAVISVWVVYARHQGSKEAERIHEETKRVMNRDEMMMLIEGCEVESVLKFEDGVVNVQYKNNYDDEGEWIWRASEADPTYYEDYIDAIRASESACGDSVAYTYNGHRWITRSEAENLLMNCEIKTFNFPGSSLLDGSYDIAGEYTGIALIDYGYVKHISVDSDKIEQMAVVAREAQDTCGHNNPQFWCGRYEQLSDEGGGEPFCD